MRTCMHTYTNTYAHVPTYLRTYMHAGSFTHLSMYSHTILHVYASIHTIIKHITVLYILYVFSAGYTGKIPGTLHNVKEIHTWHIMCNFDVLVVPTIPHFQITPAGCASMNPLPPQSLIALQEAEWKQILSAQAMEQVFVLLGVLAMKLCLVFFAWCFHRIVLIWH